MNLRKLFYPYIFCLLIPTQFFMFQFGKEDKSFSSPPPPLLLHLVQFHILPSSSVQSYFLFGPIPYRPFPPCPSLSYPILLRSVLYRTVPSSSVPSCLPSSCPTLSHTVQLTSVSSWPITFHPILSHFVSHVLLSPDPSYSVLFPPVIFYLVASPMQCCCCLLLPILRRPVSFCQDLPCPTPLNLAICLLFALIHVSPCSVTSCHRVPIQLPSISLLSSFRHL